MLTNVHEIVYNFDIYCGKILYVLKSNNSILLYWQTFKSDLSVFRKDNGRKHLQSVGAGSSISGVIVQKIWPQIRGGGHDAMAPPFGPTATVLQKKKKCTENDIKKVALSRRASTKMPR